MECLFRFDEVPLYMSAELSHNTCLKSESSRYNTFELGYHRKKLASEVSQSFGLKFCPSNCPVPVFIFGLSICFYR
jgi:hypothetical protein